MPFESQAEGRKVAQFFVDGKISDETFEEWNRETRSKKLPERAGSEVEANPNSEGHYADDGPRRKRDA